jgi:hypothetical protein
MKNIIIIIFLISVSVASFALYAGITHNPMDVFCIIRVTCDFNYIYAAFIWFSWFIPVFFSPLIIVVVLRYYFLISSST